MNSVILHCLDAESYALWQRGEYLPQSLSSDGFVHLCTCSQLPWVIETFYGDGDGVHLLLIDASSLGAALKYEAAAGTDAAPDGLFPHLYAPIPTLSVLDCVSYSMFCRSRPRVISRRHRQLLQRYAFARLPVEGTLYISTWRSDVDTADGGPVGTAMLGMYSDFPFSVSCFHRLAFDEVWHFYEGSPLDLFLLHPDGRTEQVRLGPDDLRQFVVPKGVWQAGRLAQAAEDSSLTSWPTSSHANESRYALFGCTMAPGFHGRCFEAAQPSTLKQRYPSWAALIDELSVNDEHTQMPDGFAP